MLKITWPEVPLSSSVVAAPLSSAELIPVGSPTYKRLQELVLDLPHKVHFCHLNGRLSNQNINTSLLVYWYGLCCELVLHHIWILL